MLHLVAIAGLALGAAANADSTGQTTRVSVSSDGTQGDSGSSAPSISADGRFVSFSSYASNLVPGDTNEESDLFIHDRTSGQTTRINVDWSGTDAASFSNPSSISADGRFVAFQSDGSSLVPGDANEELDVFIHDRTSGRTNRASVDSSGTEANRSSLSPSISADGRFVAFTSWASNLVLGDTNEKPDVFIHDRTSGQTTRVNVDSSGTEANETSYNPSISTDGRFVTFTSHASNLVPGDTNSVRDPFGGSDVFVRDRSTGQTTRVSVGSDGTQGNENSFLASISADGRFVTFTSFASNLVSEDANEDSDVFVHDRSTGQTTLINVSSDGSQGIGESLAQSISVDGRFVAFTSWASNLVPDDANEDSDIFVHDRDTGRTVRVSVDSDGLEGNSGANLPAISAGGCVMAFTSRSSNLAPGDTNEASDVFVHQRNSAAPRTPVEPNDIPDDATDISGCWQHYHASLPDRSPRGWDLTRQSEGIFEDYYNLVSVPPLATADIWTTRLTELGLNSEMDRDFFRTQFPDPRHYPGSNDIRPEHRRLAGGTPEPMPECGLIRRQSWSPGTSSELVNIALSGRLDVTVIPMVSPDGGSALDPSSEVIYVYRDWASPPVASRSGPPLRLSIYCPQSREDLALDEALISIGERVTERPSTHTGVYTLQLDYIIEARRGIPKWVDELADAEGLLTLVGLPCPPPSSGAFPYCVPVPDARVELAHPHTPRFFDCIADGPGCWDPLLMTLQKPMGQMELLFHAHPEMTFALYSPEQELIAQAEPFAKDESVDGVPQLASRLLVEALEPGQYVLVVNGPPGSYAINYRQFDQGDLKDVD